MNVPCLFIVLPLLPRSLRLCCCLYSLRTGFSCFSLAEWGAKCAWAVPAAGEGGGGGDAHCRLCRTGKWRVPTTSARGTKILSTCFPTSSEAGGSIASYHIEQRPEWILFLVERDLPNETVRRWVLLFCFLLFHCFLSAAKPRPWNSVEVVGAVVGFVVTIFIFNSFSRYKILYKIRFID